MKIIFGTLIGAVISILVIELVKFTMPSKRDSSTLIEISNDTDNKVSLIELESNNGQKFSCSLKYNKCSLGLLDVGDASFSIKATLDTGVIIYNEIGYAESGSTHNLSISEFN